MHKFFPLFFILPLFLFGWAVFNFVQYPMHMQFPSPRTETATPTTQGESVYFSRSTDNLPEAKPSEEVVLKNGDTYAMTVSAVKKTINGKEIRLLAYNGMLPGPRLRVQQGDEVTILLHNASDIETTLHPHGVRVDNAFDGVADVTQKTIKPGEDFSYKLRFPDAGLFWYHPHVRDDFQQESGLYANIRVEPRSSAKPAKKSAEEYLFIDDISLDANGLTPFFQAFTNYALMGRFGETMMVNWKTDYTLSAQEGEIKRLYITNSANTRTFRLTLPGAKIKLVGSDGGLYERETFVDELTIAPTERYIVDVFFPKAGSYTLLHSTPISQYKLGDVTVSAGSTDAVQQKEFETLHVQSDVTQEMAPLHALVSKSPDKELRLDLDMGMGGMNHQMMMGTDGDKIEWEDTMPGMNRMMTSENTVWKIIDAQTGKANMDIAWTFQQGDLVKIRLYNDPRGAHPMQHPIHFHGQRFVVLSTNGVENTNLVWKDTTLVPSGDTVDLLVEMSNPGTWMAHCHIAEHLHSGMMFEYTVQAKK